MVLLPQGAHLLGLPFFYKPGQFRAVFVAEKFDHVAAPGYAKARGLDTQPPNRQYVSPLLGKPLVVRPLVEDVSLDRPQVFRPLLFEVDERPLSPAERKVLDA